MRENSPALHLAEEKVLPVPCLGTNRGTQVLLPRCPHHSWVLGLGHGGDTQGGTCV